MLSQADNGSDRRGSELSDDATEICDLDSDVLNQPASEAEVRDALVKLKTVKAYGLDKILAKMSKLGCRKIIMFLVTYSNILFDKGDYPREWAKAIIVPIHTTGNADLPDNYRGVSLFSVVTKCYTFILNKCLYTWLEENNNMSKSKQGFVKPIL